MAEWSDTLKKGLASTTPPTKALIGLGMLLFLMVACGDEQKSSKPTQQSSNKTSGFPSDQERQPLRPSRQLVQVSNACPEWGTPELFKIDVIRRCIAEGLNPNAKIEKETLLTTVARMPGQDATEAVQVLLDAGANVDVQNKEGATALMAASVRGHTATVQVLLDAGANVDVQNKEGATAFMAASMKGHTATVQVLLAAGADVNAQINNPGNLEVHGFTALMIASMGGHAATVQALLAAGADPNLQSKIGATALILASGVGHTATVQALLAAEANVNAQINDRRSRYEGFTALMLASGAGHTATVQALLDAGAVLDVQGRKGQTASDIAEARGHTEIGKMIERAAAFR